jgi:hypothetical protein
MSDQTDQHQFSSVLLALGSVGLAILSAWVAYEAWRSDNWFRLLITAPGALLFAYCAAGWIRRFRSRQDCAACEERITRR